MARSNCALRSSGVNVARGSMAICSGEVNTFLSLVSRTVYVPGSTRGPRLAPNEADAAGGTVGALMRIDHVTRDSPRRLLVGIVPTTLPAASVTSRVDRKSHV